MTELSQIIDELMEGKVIEEKVNLASLTQILPSPGINWNDGVPHLMPWNNDPIDSARYAFRSPDLLTLYPSTPIPKPITILIFVCSPFRADSNGKLQRNINYAGDIARRLIFESEFNVPIIPHLMYPQFLDDNNPIDHEQGLKLCLSLVARCDIIYVGEDFGISENMHKEIQRANSLLKRVIYSGTTTMSSDYYKNIGD